MAQIPDSSGFGDVTVQAQRAPAGVAGAIAAFAAPVGQSLTNLGRDARTLEIQQAREADIQRKAADKAQAMVALQSAQDDLAELHDTMSAGILTGEVDKTKAGEQFNEAARDRMAKALENVPEEFKALSQVHLDGKVSRLGRSIGKVVTQRNQQEVAVSIDQVLERASRLYMKDPQQADAMVSGTLDQLGPHSGLTPLQIQQKRQTFKETGAYNLASALVNGSRTDNRALDGIATRLNSDEFANMDPGRKTQLLTAVEGFRVSNAQRAESEARRLQADSERRLRLAESQFNAAESIVNTGKVLSPEFVDQVSKSVAGTPYEAAFRESLKQGPQNASFGAQPLAVQQQALVEARAKLNATGTDPKTEKRVAELQRIHDEAVKDYAEDPLVAAQSRGILQSIEPVNTADIPSLLGSLGNRIQQAQIVSQQVGGTVSPLTKVEAERVGKILAILPVDQRTTALATLGETVGPELASAMGRQMAPNGASLISKADGITLAMGGMKTTAGRHASQLVQRGAQALKDKAVAPDDKSLTGVRAQVAAEIGDAYQNQEVRSAMIDAAVLIEYGLRSEGSGDIRQAVDFATGNLAERNGRKLPMPQGMKLDTFETKLRAITPADIAKQLPDGTVYAGSTKLDPAQFIKALPDAVLLHAGQGKYFVQSGGTLVSNAKRQPIVITVR